MCSQPSVDGLLRRYEDVYHKRDRIELDTERFDRAIERGDRDGWGVGALVVDDGSVLLVREEDGWLVPGGRLECGEPPAAGAAREVYEETGIEADVTTLAAIAEQTFLRGEGDDSYQFTFLTFLATPVEETAPSATDPSIRAAEWHEAIPENTFDRDLVVRLFDAYL
ncbi:MAG: NUDIX hydrolase [Natronomonas sp.]